jgi:hypothetical protein
LFLSSNIDLAGVDVDRDLVQVTLLDVLRRDERAALDGRIFTRSSSPLRNRINMAFLHTLLLERTLEQILTRISLPHLPPLRPLLQFLSMLPFKERWLSRACYNLINVNIGLITLGVSFVIDSSWEATLDGGSISDRDGPSYQIIGRVGFRESTTKSRYLLTSFGRDRSTKRRCDRAEDDSGNE